MNHFITTEAVIAHSLCSRRGFFEVRGELQGSIHEYERVINERAARNRSHYLAGLTENELPAIPGDANQKLLVSNIDPAHIVVAEDLLATCDALVKKTTENDKACYEPHLVVGTRTVSNEQKLALAYAGYVIGQTKRYRPSVGMIAPLGSRPVRVRLQSAYSDVHSIITNLRGFLNLRSSDPPPLILNQNCPTCPFRHHCLREAEETDNLTLLQKMTPKLLKRYANKGVFTVNQLSYLFRPRRRRKRSPVAQPSFNIELQALAIRAKKIYLHEAPTLEEQPVEMYLDIEGLPDQNFDYLIGLSVKNHDSIKMQSFWADTAGDERQIFQECIKAAKAFPNAPVYHYGSYERRAFEHAAKEYGIDCTEVLARLVNLNSFIFGKIYFPTKSNRLKDLGKFVGASWTATEASGLLSIAWRNRWEDSGEERLKDMLLSYNQEDCDAVRLLLRELQNLASSAKSRPDVDSPSTLKTNTTETGQAIHDTFDRILKSAHLKYQEKRIHLSSEETYEPSLRKRTGRRAKPLPRMVGKEIKVSSKRKCSNCVNQKLKRSKKLASHSLIDLKFTRNGCGKTVIKYVGNVAFCPICKSYYSPPAIKRLRSKNYGRKFRCWLTYARIILRLPFRVLGEVVETLFHERIPAATICRLVTSISQEYETTEKLLENAIVKAPFIHIDETKVNIQGTSYYAWVLTDGKHVAFKLSDTRQISIIEPLLADYGGVLVSDFYGGYDSLACRQQKCLVHLIRDLNDDLWKNPFNEDYECFVGTVRDLLLPIFEDVNRWGLKAHFLKKHSKAVDRFYTKVIEVTGCRSEPVETYRKRFNRYRKSLFLFLTEDSVPWNNNMAERALRHLSVQQKISGCFMGSGADDYLRLLGICQTCRFQDKSFLQFLLTGEKDVDQFKCRKRR